MAKALLLNALHNALSDYVVGLSPERLKVGVWSGKIVLEELQVNPEVANQLRLPVNVIHGTVKKLEVEIPWMKLGSRPVKVHLEGVCVLVGPVDKDSWGDDEVRERRLNTKRASLENAEAASAKKEGDGNGNDEDVQQGFVEKLMQRIVDNIEINVADIHIRYEDTLLVPGQMISAGVCLESFVVATTDSSFVPKFIDRTGNDSWRTRVHKLARVTGFSVYWRVNDKERYELIPPEIRSAALTKFVSEQAVAPPADNGGGLERGDLIRPIGAVLKFIHCDHAEDMTGPKFAASFEMDDVKMDFRAEQYEQALTLKDSITALANWQTFFPYRPKATPRQDPKAWWRYAFVCVRGKPNHSTNVNKIIMSRKEYVFLYEKVATDAKKTSSKESTPSLTGQEQRRLDELEEDLPLQTIVMFRTMARREIQRKQDAARARLNNEELAALEKKEIGGGSWWGSLWGGASTKKEEGDLALRDLTANFGEDVGEHKVPPDYLHARLTVKPHGSITLYGRRDLRLVEASMVASATAELREDSSMAFSFCLSRLDVLDLFTQGAVFPEMLKVGGHESEDGNNAPELSKARAKVAAAVAAGAVGTNRIGRRSRLVRGGQEEAPLACLNAALSADTLKVDVCALSTDVVYNREAVDAVLSVFIARPAETKEAMSNVTKGLEAAQQKTKVKLPGLSISVSLDVVAPRVIVPVSSSRDDGFLLLDMGHMLIEGGSVEGGAMEYRGEFTDMNARLPAKKSELLVRGDMNAVIEPFRVETRARVGADVSEPGVVVTMEVMPGVKGVISPEKIRGLYKVLDYVTNAHIQASLGLDASDPVVGAGDTGVERMGEGDGVVAIDFGNAAGNSEPLVLWEWRLKVPTIGLLLVDHRKPGANMDNGLLAEAAGMCMGVKNSRKDMVVRLHLDAVTVQDMARPKDSPFRYMMHSTPDETSHGGLIHVTYWASAGGVRRVPPRSVAGTNQTKFDMVLDARISTLQAALDKESVVKATPFYQAVMRQDGAQHTRAMAATLVGAGGVGLSDPNSPIDDDPFFVIRTAGSRVADAARRMATEGFRPKIILLQASLTSVLFELVRSNPWETVVRAGMSGLKASFSLNEQGRDATKTTVTLADIVVTDVRPEAKGNPFSVLLAPLATSPKGAAAQTGQQAWAGGSTDGNFSSRQVDGTSTSRVVSVCEGGGVAETGPLVAVMITTSGDGGPLDAEVHLASFACNVMVDAIRDALLALVEVNEALLKMLGGIDSGIGGARDSSRIGGDPPGMLSNLGDVQEPGCEFAWMRGGSLGLGQENHTEQTFGRAAPEDVSGYRHDRGGAGRQRENMARKPALSSPPIRVRLVLDDWRINLVEEPSKATSRIVVLRAKWVATFKRLITTEDGGICTEDNFHLSCLRSEYLVDAPAFGSGSGRKISQVLEPFTSEFSANLLSTEGSLRGAKFNVMVEAVQTRLSYSDMMLFKRIANRANAAYEKVSSVLPNNKDNDDVSESGGGSMVSFLPDTYQDTSQPWSRRKEAARVAAVKVATKAGVQPSTMAAMSFSATCSMARVVLVNDYEGQGVPVLRFSSRELKAEGNGYKEDFSLKVSGVAEVEFFNVKVVRWEPLTEPWRPVLTAAVGMNFKGRTTLQIKLACEEVIVFNVTSDFMESFLSTYWMLYSDGVAKDDPLALLSGGTEVTGRDGSKGETPEVAASTAELASSWPELSGQNQSGWAEGPVPPEELKEGSVTLKNTTGFQLAVGTTDFPEKSLSLGGMDTVRLPFEAHRDPANAGEFDLRGKAALVGWAEEDMQRTREGLPPLKVDRAGVQVFPLLPTTPMPAGYVASAPVVVEVYQSQRYSMVTGEWSKPYMVHDGPEFSTKDWRHAHPTDNRERPLDSIALPDERYWSWRDSWHVDFSKNVGTEIDEAGWEYRVEFASFNLINSSRTRRDLDQARRRKWIRTRAPKPLPMDDPFRPLHLAWQVDVTPQGRLEATIRSTVQMTNSTGLPLEVRALCSAWPPKEDFSEGPGRRSLGSVAPGCTLDVPIKMVYASHLQLRPVSFSSSSSAAFASITVGGRIGVEASPGERPFEWSAPLPLLSNNVDTSRDDWVSCRQVAGGGDAGQTPTVATIKLVVHAKTTPEGCVVMTVLPPVTVANALPCPLKFRAFLPPASATETARRDSSSWGLAPPAPDAAAKPTATLLEVGRIPTAETSHLHTLEVGDGAKFSIKIEHHGWSAALTLLPRTTEDLRAGRWANRGVTFKVPCLRDDGGVGGAGRGSGGYLEIRCLLEQQVGPSCPAVRLHLFCTHWLIDRSGLGLGFGISDNRRLAVPVVRHNAASTTAAAGGMHPPLHVHVSPVEQLSCASTRGVLISRASVGGLLYTDRGFVFTKDSLPPSFLGATMIRTACSDKHDGSEHFLRFRVAEASTVHVLFDRHCPSPPGWLTSAFRLTTTRVHVSNRGAEGAFVVWSRDVPAGSWVSLGGNRARGAESMYLVVVTEQDMAVPFTPSASSVFKRKISNREELMESWSLGTEGLSLCNSPDERVRVAVPEGAGRVGGGGVYGHDGFSGCTRDVWSAELHVPGGASGVFQVRGTQGEVYELALRAEVCPGIFHRTTQVTVIPRYCVVNLLKDENIWLKQPGAPEASAACLPPGSRLPWHWMLRKTDGIRVRTDTTAWSYGEVAIHRVGTTALHVPAVARTEASGAHARGQAGGYANDMLDIFGSVPTGGTDRGASQGSAGRGERDGEQTVVHVDVQLPDEPFVDEYSLLVVFWKANERFAPIYSASNASPVTVHLHQAGPDREGRQPLSAKDVWKVEPGEQREIGWSYPAAQRSLVIHTGSSSHAVELSTDTAGNYAKLPTAPERGSDVFAPTAATGQDFIWASVVVKGATKVIHISSRPPPGSDTGGRSSISDGNQLQPQRQQRSQQYQQQSPLLQFHHQQQQLQRQNQQQQQQMQQRAQHNNLEKEAARKRRQESEAPALELVVDMCGLGVSLIGPVDGRRHELVYAQVSDVRAKLSRDRLSSVQASIGSVQVDNHLPGAIFPVLVSKRQEETPPHDDEHRGDNINRHSGRAQRQRTPFLQLSIIKEVDQNTNTAHYDYVACRMLEVDVMADRATLLHLLVWCKPLQGYLLMWRQQLDSRAWVAKRTAEVLERGAQAVPGGSVDVEQVRRTARIQRKYVKTMQFHPVIVRISYVNSAASDKLVANAGMPIINKIPTLMKSNIDLASYLVDDTFGSVRDISKNVMAHYYVAGTTQLLSLVGSMRALGSPADLIGNVGGGVKALVYAPAQGLVQGPAEFFEGVSRGAHTFVKGTVHGVLNSVAGVGGAVTDTVSKLSFDNDYQKKRELSKNKAMANQGGVREGLAQGGKDILGGFASGVSGIITAPVSGAKKGGVGGFFKGVGKGLVGAVVKPAVGVTDSVLSVAQGISNSAVNTQRQEHLRPRRALTQDSDTGRLVVVNYSTEAAEAQALVESGVEEKEREGDSKDKYESHTQISNLTIIFANTRMILVKRTQNDRLGSAKMLKQSGAVKPLQMVSKAWEEVASVSVIGESIVIGRYQGGNISLKAALAPRREELYRQFYVHRHKMGDPTSMRSPEGVFGAEHSREAPPPMAMTMRAHSMAMQESLRGYTFGSAFGRQLQSHGFTDAQILDRAERQLQSIASGDWHNLDNVTWELVHNWNTAHTGMNTTRCLCVVFINASTSAVQFLEMRKRDGQSYRLMVGPLCDVDSQQLMPGGVAILFAWGHPSTNILKKGFVVMVAETTAFSGVFAVQREKVTMASKSSFQAGFLEKNIQEWWSKQVVVVT